MAKQSFQAECDINQIMRKYQASGLIDHTNKIQGAYGDFTSVEDYHQSINRVMAADQAFNNLPSSLRRRFENDPARFLAFVEDPQNEDEAIDLGLLPPKASDIAGEAGQSTPVEPLKTVSPAKAKKNGPPDGGSSQEASANEAD